MSQIKAKVVADSINAKTGIRLTTFEYEGYRGILAETNTHRVFSRNAESSRAVPVKSMIAKVWNDPYIPIWWGKNQAGMQAKEELTGFRLALAKFVWKLSSKVACGLAYSMWKVGMHKQLSNRILEGFMINKGVISSTEWENWDSLRAHEDAQPEIRALALAMIEAKNASTPVTLYPGQWHLPYVDCRIEGLGSMSVQKYFDENGTEISLIDALKISASCCAQVSYRKNDLSLEKAEKVFDRLIYSDPPHMSPVEHQATPMDTIDRNQFSKNFRNWYQYRVILESTK